MVSRGGLCIYMFAGIFGELGEARGLGEAGYDPSSVSKQRCRSHVRSLDIANHVSRQHRAFQLSVLQVGR